MPPHQRLGSYQEGSPTCLWEQAAECREDRPICWSIPHAPVELAFENTNLMSEHHDLDVFVRLASPTRHNKAEDATQADVEQGEGHGGSWPNGDAQCQSRGLIVVLVPFSFGMLTAPLGHEHDNSSKLTPRNPGHIRASKIPGAIQLHLARDDRRGF